MSDRFDITTFGRGRTGYEPRVIEAPKKVPPTPGKAAELQRELDRATLALSSARRTLRTYRFGVRALTLSATAGGLMGVSGIATAIGSTAVGLNATTAVLWLVLFGLPVLLLSVGGMFLWHNMHRIKYEWVRKEGYTYVNYVIDGKDYVDPQLNVEVAELAYGRAVARMTEHAE